jgi:hypothetical protein
MQLVDVVPTDADVATASERPVPQQLRPDATPFFPLPDAPGGAAGQETRAGEAQRPIDAVGDRLRPRLGHVDVWTPARGRLPDPTPDEVVRMRVADRLTAYNDSMQAEAERIRRLTDWTVRDASGGRWGAADGKIHLGSITLPGRIDVQTPPGRREEIQKRSIQWKEIQEQAERQRIREIFDDRARAVRARVDAERDTSRVRPPITTTTGGGGAGG